MRLSWVIAGFLAVLPAPAGTIVVTNSPTVTVNPGDRLRFEFEAWNFGRYVKNGYPASVAFTFATMPLEGASPLLGISLEAEDGELVKSLDQPVAFSQGSMKSSKYSGPVSILSASFALTATESSTLFGPGAKDTAALVIRGFDRAFTLGVAGRTIAQDISIGLSGGGLSIGAALGTVELEEAPVAALDAPLAPETVPVPEPSTLAMLGAAVAAVVARGLRRRVRGA